MRKKPKSTQTEKGIVLTCPTKEIVERGTKKEWGGELLEAVYTLRNQKFTMKLKVVDASCAEKSDVPKNRPSNTRKFISQRKNSKPLSTAVSTF